MDIARLNQLADFIEKLPDDDFEMALYATACGTTHCIGGWAVVMFAPEDALRFKDLERGVRVGVVNPLWFEKGRQVLGLSAYQAEDLFVPSDIEYRSKEEAVAVIRTLAETGRVVWSEGDTIDD